MPISYLARSTRVGAMAFEGEIGPDTTEERDRALLHRAEPGSRVAILSEPVVSLGIAQSPDHRAAREARRRGIRVVRRSTGGTGLFLLPGDIVWSLVLPRADPRVGPDYTRGYARLGQGVVDAFRDIGLDASWSPPLGLDDGYCLFSRRGQVLTVGSRVLGGAAQHLTRSALLHHGIIGVRVDRALIGALFGTSDGALRDRLGSLSELGLGVSSSRLGEALAARLALQAGVG